MCMTTILYNTHKTSCWWKVLVVCIHFFTQPLEHSRIVHLINYLSWWFKFIVNTPWISKLVINNVLIFLYWLTEFFLFWRIRWLPLGTLSLCFRSYAKTPQVYHLSLFCPNIILPVQQVCGTVQSSFIFVRRWAPLDHFGAHTACACQDLHLKFSAQFPWQCLLGLLYISWLVVDFHAQLVSFCNVFIHLVCHWLLYSLFISHLFPPLIQFLQHCFLHSISQYTCVNISCISLPLLPSFTKKFDVCSLF